MRRRVLSLWIFLMPLPGIAAATSDVFKTYGHGKRAGYLAPDDDVRRITALPDVTTPHIEFAKPLSGGPLRVLAIAQKSLGRWPIELRQRFGFRVDTVYCHSADSIGAPATTTFFGQRQADIEARLLQAMNKHVDVVISDVHVAALGEKVNARLAARMDGGTGYVGLVDVPDVGEVPPLLSQQAALVASAVPVGGLRLLSESYGTVERAAEHILALRQGNGGQRTALLASYPRDDAPPDHQRLQYPWLPSMEREAWYSLIGKTALWTAGRLEAKSRLTASLPPKKLQRSALPRRILPNVGLDDVQIDIRDADGRPCDAPAGSLPLLPCGRYFLTLRETSQGKVADWAFGWFDVHAPVGIDEVRLDRDRLRPDESVEAAVSVRGTPPQGSQIVWEILDNYGRCVAREIQPAAEMNRFTAGVSRSLHLYNYTNAKLIGPDGLILDESRRAFVIAHPNPPTDDISLMVWEGGASFHPRLRQLLTRFSQLDIDAVLNGTSEDTVLAAAIANMHMVPYVTRVYPDKVDENGIRHPCLTDPDHNASLRTRLVNITRSLKQYAPLSYSLGDDQSYIRPGQEGCWSPTCKDAFSEWARARYGTTDEVNEAWSTAYDDFDDVEPIRRSEVQASVDTDLGPICHWVDHQLFVDTLLARWHRDMADAIEREDPNAVAWYDCTIEGWMRPGSAFDFWQLGSLSRFCVQYPNPMVHDILRETASRDAYHGTWYGGYGIYNVYPYYDADTQPWWCLFRGINLHGLYYGGTGKGYFDERLIGADLGLMPMFEGLMGTIDELRGGIAKLILNAQRQDDDVAIVFSRPSNHLTMILPQELPWAPQWEGQFTGSPSFVYMQHWEAMSALVSDLGLSYRAVRCQDLTASALDPDECRLLVLPLTLRITADEAQAIRQFVEKGGVVLADAFPAWFDERSRAGSALLDDVFGCSTAGRVPGLDAKERTVTTKEGHSLGGLVVAGPLALNGAVPHASDGDGTPILLINSFGKGYAVLLNVLSRDYQIWRTLGTESAFREAVAGLLEETGVPRAPIRCEVMVRGENDPRPLPACEIHRYRLGEATYVGFMRMAKMRPDDMLFMADNRPKPVWIQFPETAHVYDVRRSAYRGSVNRLDDVLYPGRTELFALLPYEVQGLDVSCSPVPGGVHMRAQVRADIGGNLTTHVLRIEMLDPSGEERRELARNVLAERGQTEQVVFVGHLASPGPWTLRVKDVASGVVREESFDIPTYRGPANFGACRSFLKWQKLRNL